MNHSQLLFALPDLRPSHFRQERLAARNTFWSDRLFPVSPKQAQWGWRFPHGHGVRHPHLILSSVSRHRRDDGQELCTEGGSGGTGSLGWVLREAPGKAVCGDGIGASIGVIQRVRTLRSLAFARDDGKGSLGMTGRDRSG